MSQSSISNSSGPSVSTAGHPIHPGSAYPRAFGDYLLLTSFGRGGMGEVYLAKKAQIEGIDHLCVLKRLRSDLGEEEEYVRRFIDEARLVVQLNHGNICHVFDVGRVGPDHFLAMEYIAGVNLRTVTDRLKQLGEGISTGLALYLVSEVLDALDYAHRYSDQVSGESINLVHRDVSPHNVMVSFEGETKLIDFGLAASELRDEKTESHVVMGKVSYMSPEQARGDEVDGSTDQFATAIILYELLTGKRFYGERRLHEIWQIVGVGGYLPDGFDDDVDEALAPILKRALAGKAEERFPSCEDFRDEVVKLLHTTHGSVGKKQLRALVQRVCVIEQKQHRDVLKTFQDLSAQTVQESTEATMSFASKATPPSDSHSLPTGVMPREQALKVGAFGSETEETATATAFLGPQGARVPAAEQSSSAVVPGPTWARPIVMGLLITLGVVGGVWGAGFFDDPARDLILAERPMPALSKVREEPVLPTAAAATTPETPAVAGGPGGQAAGEANTDAVDEQAVPPVDEPAPETETESKTVVAATSRTRSGSRSRNRRTQTEPKVTSTTQTPPTVDAPADVPAATDPPGTADDPRGEPTAGPVAAPFTVEPDPPTPVVDPPVEPETPPKRLSPVDIALAMSTDEVRAVLRQLSDSPHSCVGALSKYGVVADAEASKLDTPAIRKLIGNCAHKTGFDLR